MQITYLTQFYEIFIARYLEMSLRTNKTTHNNLTDLYCEDKSC